MALGTVVGLAAYVATLGLSLTVAHQIRSSFNAALATEVDVTATSVDQTTVLNLNPTKVRILNGVTGAGLDRKSVV